MDYQYRLFYSWQSDNQDSRKALRKMLDAIVKHFKTENIAIEILEGGGGQGFVSIEDSVRFKIQQCDFFVGDITPVGNVALKSKLLPNANVMYEMGIATECMTADRILAVAKKGDWNIEDMPFDFNHYSIVAFEDEKDLNRLKSRIKDCLEASNRLSKRINRRFFSDRLLNRNVSSGKYLPETFLENRHAKDVARLFVLPSKMYQYVYERLCNLNFDYLNGVNKQIGQNTSNVKLKLQQYSIQGKAFDLLKVYDIAKNLKNYLNQFVDDLSQSNNQGWANSLKVKRLGDNVAVLNKRLMVITSEAGGGKTNFVCDIVKNVLTPNEIPYVFLNAYELAPDRLAESIAREYNFIGNGSLETVLLDAERFCQQHLQFLVIVIDGLNEHPNQRIFRMNLLKVLKSVLSFEHVKVMMTCRKNFLKNNYSVLAQTFGNDYVEIELNNRPGYDGELVKNQEECIFERYEQYFKVKGHVHPSIRENLSENLLLLRIFFEVYQGQDVGSMPFLDYVDIYESYYSQLCNKIENILSEDIHIIETKSVPAKLFEGILEWMINNDTFSNMPFLDLQKSFSESEKLAFLSFLNANLILQQDTIEMGASMRDVINFTFEEIRDFLLAKYLIEIKFSQNPSDFERLVATYTTDSNNLSDGLRRFLFIYARDKHKEDVIAFLKTLSWFDEVYSTYIWDVKDEYLTDVDRDKILGYFSSEPKKSISMLAFYHWSPVKFKNVNLNLLFAFLDNMSDKDKTAILEIVWPSKSEKKYYWQRNEISKRKQMLQVLKDGIERRNADGEKHEEIEVLEKLSDYLINYSDEKQSVPVARTTHSEHYNIIGYDFYRYIMTVHKGDKKEFMKRAGVKSGFAKEFFSNLYESVFAEAIDVEELYMRYYSKEYQTLEKFISMHYGIPNSEVSSFVTSIKSGDYRIIDFSTIDYGNGQFNNFFTSDEMMLRMYNWLNWYRNEN